MEKTLKEQKELNTYYWNCPSCDLKNEENILQCKCGCWCDGTELLITNCLVDTLTRNGFIATSTKTDDKGFRDE